jgi:predicted PurR-regulated permease PerM
MIVASALSGAPRQKEASRMADPGTDAPSGLAAGAREAWAKRDRVTWTLVGILILVAVGAWGFLQIWEAFATFIIGGLLAFLLRPVVGLFMKWKLSRGLAVLVTALLLVGLIVLGMMWLVPRIAVQFQEFSANLPKYQAAIQSTVEEFTTKYAGLPTSAQGAAQNLAKQTAETFTAALNQLTSFILAAGGTALGFGFNFFMGFIICIWLLLSGPQVAKWSVSVLPPGWRDDAREIGTTFNDSFGGFIRGSVINMTVTFVGCAVGFTIIGLPFAMPIALIIGLLDIIPFVGPIIGGAIAVLVALTVSWQLAVLTLIVVLIVEQSVDSVLSPIVMGDSVSLHPLGILLALSIGGAVGGLFGVIISIPVAAAGYSVYMYFMRKNGILEPAAPKPEKKPKKGKRAAEPA